MEIQIGNKTREVSLLSKEGDQLQLEIDGEVYNVDITMLENGVCSILNEGDSYFVKLDKSSDNAKHYHVNVGYSSFEIDMLDSQAKYMRMRRKGSGHNENQADNITAPMPCRIEKVFVQPGDELKAGDAVLTIEAMKMLSNYKVTADCTVKEVLVKEGDSVSQNQVLVKVSVKS